MEKRRGDGNEMIKRRGKCLQKREATYKGGGKCTGNKRKCNGKKVRKKKIKVMQKSKNMKTNGILTEYKRKKYSG